MQSDKDGLENAVDIGHHIVIPKSQNAAIVVSQPLIPDKISLIFVVLTTIDFDDQALFAAEEISDVGTYRFLPDEFIAAQRTISQSIPQA